MKNYILCGYSECDFSEGHSTHLCEKVFCNSHEEGYVLYETDIEIGCASLEEFNELYGTDI